MSEMASAARFLVVDGYDRKGRAAVVRSGGQEAGACYASAIRAVAPNVAVDVICPADADAGFPTGGGFVDYDGLVWTGSSLNIYNGGPAIERQIAFARAGYRSRVPMFGSCWALQVAAVAAGGAVAVNPLGREVGVARKIALTAAGRAHPMYRGKPSVFDAPAIHLDIVTALPTGSTVLAANRMADIQAAEIGHDGGSFWGVQYHPEYDLATMAATFRRVAGRLVEEGHCADLGAVAAYVADLEALAADPARKDLAWKLGLDADVLDPQVRLAELANWIAAKVAPPL